MNGDEQHWAALVAQSFTTGHTQGEPEILAMIREAHRRLGIPPVPRGDRRTLREATVEAEARNEATLARILAEDEIERNCPDGPEAHRFGFDGAGRKFPPCPSCAERKALL